ncbi:MAG: hypothetical protein ABSH26_10125 [Opitutaceae bacterium]|jgi:hypothetical protein
MISTFTDSAAGPKADSHARISAVGLTAGNLRSILGLPPAHAHTSNRGDLFGAASTEDLFGQFWSPGLLDRLQEPLSRYHE